MVNDKRFSMNMMTMTRFKISNKRLYAILIIVSVIFFGFVALAGMIHTYQNSYPLGNINRNFYTWMYQSESGVLFFLILGMIFSFLSVHLFPKRKSFLD